MFQQYIKRVELSSALAVHRVYGAAIVALLLVIALVFATAGADAAAVERFGLRDGRLLMSAVFAGLAILAYVVAQLRNASERKAAQAMIDANKAAEAFGPGLLDSMPLATALLGGLKDAAPGAARAAASVAPKHAPLLIGAGVGLFVAQRLVNYYREMRQS